eukprot:6265110-Prymnesium_polylepis.1
MTHCYTRGMPYCVPWHEKSTSLELVGSRPNPQPQSANRHTRDAECGDFTLQTTLYGGYG